MINKEKSYTCNDVQIKYTIVQLFKINKKDSQNSCFKTVLTEIKKVLIIYGPQKQLQNVNRLTKNLLILTKRLERSCKCHERYLPTYDISIFVNDLQRESYSDVLRRRMTSLFEITKSTKSTDIDIESSFSCQSLFSLLKNIKKIDQIFLFKKITFSYTFIIIRQLYIHYTTLYVCYN